jgi:ketosteroid isomerase-like protein
MRASVKCLALIAIVLALFSTAHAAASNKADKAAIKALEQGFAAAFSAKDIPKILSFFAPGDKLLVFDVMTPRQYVGSDAYKASWENFVKSTTGPFHLELSDLQVTTGGGNVAFAHLIHHVTGRMSDGTPLDMTTRVSHDFQKIRGKWLIVHEHVSVPIDFSTGKPDFQSKP